MYLTIGGVDYAAGPYMVTFPVNHTCVPLNIKITDNDEMENNKTFVLIINSSSLPRHVDVGNPYQTNVTILDDDGNCVKYAVYVYIPLGIGRIFS